MFDNLRNRMDFDDLLFKSRNKDYGAYQLRKKYNAVLFAGVLLATFVVSSVVILPFIFVSKSDHVITGGIGYVQVQMQNLQPPPDEIIVPPAPPPPEAAKIQEIVKYIPPVVVDSVPPLEPSLATNDQMLAQSDNDKIVAGASGSGEDLLSGQEGITTDEPFLMVEVMPSFKGGDINKFREWVQKRTNYPQIAIDNKIQGRVYLTFIIEPDGALSNITVVKGVDPVIDIEAVKAIQSSPKWTPGLQRGQPVRVRYSMWLNFVI